MPWCNCHIQHLYETTTIQMGLFWVGFESFFIVNVLLWINICVNKDLQFHVLHDILECWVPINFACICIKKWGWLFQWTLVPSGSRVFLLGVDGGNPLVVKKLLIPPIKKNPTVDSLHQIFIPSPPKVNPPN